MSRGRVRWATIGLVVLALVAAALAVVAVRSTGPASAPTGSTAPVSPDAQPSGSQPSGSQPSRGDVVDALPDLVEPPLLVVDAEVAYRGTTGTCLGGATLERSVDGGVRWRRLEPPAAAILSLTADGPSVLDVVGADDRCRTRVWSSRDAGSTWASAGEASGVFARVPDDVQRLATPTGVVPNPCPDRRVAPLAVEGITQTDAAVLCGGGEVLQTRDGGVTFQTLTPVAGGQALAFDGPVLGWVLQRDSGRCAGYQLLQTQDGGATWQTGGCLGSEPIADPRVLPSIDFAGPQRGMADLAGTAYVTTDSGYTWRLAR